jgi:hypothetical protein
MNYKTLTLLLWVFLSCQQPQNPSTQSQVIIDTLLQSNFNNFEPKDSNMIDNEPITCQTKGILVNYFEQNDAQFEQLKAKGKETQWLKVTTKAGRCFIIDSIAVGNQHTSTFKDWDKDGYKDRLYWLKWTYQVYLFDKYKNDFSRKIAGDFNGEQWDFDKERHLSFQYLGDTLGGNFQLYELKDTAFKVISEIRFLQIDEDNPKQSKIEIRKNIVKIREKMTCDTLKMDKTLYNAFQIKGNEPFDQWLERTKDCAKNYWKNNLSAFIIE